MTDPTAPRGERPLQILSLDGGGLKGLFSAAVLEGLERDLQTSILDHFDLRRLDGRPDRAGPGRWPVHHASPSTIFMVSTVVRPWFHGGHRGWSGFMAAGPVAVAMVAEGAVAGPGSCYGRSATRRSSGSGSWPSAPAA